MMKDASTYSPQEREEISREVANNPYTAAYIPKIIEYVQIGGVFPNSWAAMKVDNFNF